MREDIKTSISGIRWTINVVITLCVALIGGVVTIIINIFDIFF